MSNLGTNLDDLEETDETLQPKARKPKSVGLPKTRKIVLEENDSIPPTGLFLGLNGRGYMLRPGEPVDVPVGLIEILDHAVMSIPIMDPSSMQVVGYREQRRYPYREVN